ncbi:MAG: two-component regulator propeller domain-containing protein, partial [Verrucomicrobiota bacterium]
DGLVLGNPAARGKAVASVMARSDHGELWIAVNGAVSKVQDDKLVPFRFDDGGQTNFYSAILPSRDGGMWAMRNGVLQKWRDGKWAAILGAPWGADAPLSLVERRSGVLVVGTLKSGLFLLQPGFEPLQFSRTNGLSHDWVRSICEDREGNIWIGTGGGGLNVLRERRARILNPPDLWQGRSVLSTFIHGHEAWAGTEGAGLYHYDLAEKIWKNFGEPDGLTNSFVWSVLQTRREKLFVGTWDGGIFERGTSDAGQGISSVAHVSGSPFNRPPALAEISAPVTALFEDRDGSLWIGTGVGLQHFQDGKLMGLIGSDRLVLPDVRAITQSADGAIWFGMFGGGLGRVQNGVVKQFQKRDGLGSDFVECLMAEENTLWIGTGDNGICRFKNGEFFTINFERGLPNNVLCSLADDGLGNFWLATHRGISRVGKSDLDDCAMGRSKTVHCLTIGSSDGLASEICSGGFQPNYARTPDGSIWFPTAKGIVVVDPSKIKTNRWPPTVVIERFVVEGQPTGHKSDYSIGANPLAKPLQIAPGQQRFEVHYTALSFTAAGKVRFKYKLEKIENNWVDAGESRSVQFSYLPPGEYNFRVISCNNDGLWNETGASMAFTVLPFFWQTLWFRAISVAAGATLIGLAVLWVTRR